MRQVVVVSPRKAPASALPTEYRVFMQPCGEKHGATAADLAELERHEVIDGVIVEKTMPSGEHGMIQSELLAALATFRGSPAEKGPIGGWWIGTEIEIELETHQVYVPDLVGWRIERMSKRPHSKPVCATPDWVCEVLSPSSVGYDLGTKYRSYYAARIEHYWIVDPEHQQLCILQWSTEGYQTILKATPDKLVHAEPFEAIRLDVGALFGTDAASE